MEYKSLKLSELEKAKYNPRNISEKAKKGLANSIKDFGLVQPIVVNSREFEKTEKYVVISGHQRLDILSQNNETETMCVVVDLELKKEKKLNVLLNSQAISGEWNQDLLDELLQEFVEDDDYADFNFDDLETRSFIDKQTTNEDDCDLTLPEEPITKQGDLYEISNHRLLCGDSATTDDLTKLMDGKLADMIFTDPPYSINYESQKGKNDTKKKNESGAGKIFNDNLSEVQAREFYDKIAKNIFDYSTEGATFYWWFAMNKYDWNAKALEENNWNISQTIIWVKEHFVMSMGQLYHRMWEPCLVGWKSGQMKKTYRNQFLTNSKDVFNLEYDDFTELFDLWHERRDNTSSYVHPTQKPIKLAERALKKSSKKGDIVLDLFGGSGSTMMACEQMNRVSYNMELDPKFCDVIIRRICTFYQGKNKEFKLYKNGVETDYKHFLNK